MPSAALVSPLATRAMPTASDAEQETDMKARQSRQTSGAATARQHGGTLWSRACDRAKETEVRLAVWLAECPAVLFAEP